MTNTTKPDTSRTKFLLDESQMPTAWYNIQADLPTPVPAVLHPGTGQPIGPADLAPATLEISSKGSRGEVGGADGLACAGCSTAGTGVGRSAWMLYQAVAFAIHRAGTWCGRCRALLCWSWRALLLLAVFSVNLRDAWVRAEVVENGIINIIAMDASQIPARQL